MDEVKESGLILEKKVYVEPNAHKMIHLHLATFGAVSGVNGYINLINAIQILRGCFTKPSSDEILIEKLGKKKYDKVMTDFTKFTLYASEVEAHLAGLTKKQISSDEITSKRYVAYRKAVFRCPLMLHSASLIYKCLIEETSLYKVPIDSKLFIQISAETKRFDREPPSTKTERDEKRREDYREEQD